MTRCAAMSYPQASPFAPWSSPNAMPPLTTYTPADPSTAEPGAVAVIRPVRGSTPMRLEPLVR